MSKFVVVQRGPQGMLYMGDDGQWTADVAKARRFRFGVETFQTSARVWIEFAPR